VNVPTRHRWPLTFLLIVFFLAIGRNSFADCTNFSLSPQGTFPTFPSNGGSSHFLVNRGTNLTADTGCDWEISSTSFLHPSPLSGGAQVQTDVTFTVDPNPDLAARTGFIMVTETEDHQVLTQTINQSAATGDFSFTITPSQQKVVAGTSATFEVDISRSGQFTGEVSLQVSGVPSNDVVTFSNVTHTHATVTITTRPPAGTFTMTITGANGNTKHSNTATVQVTDFTLTIDPSSVTVQQGASATAQIAINPINGFDGSVNFGPSNVPTGVAFAFSPSSATTKGTITISANGSSPLGTFTSFIAGTSSGQSRSASLDVTVNGFTLTACDHLAVPPGGSGQCTIAINGTSAGPVTFSAPSVPAGVTATFNPNPATAATTLTVTVASTVSPGTYSAVINGTDGNNISKQAATRILVATPPTATRFVALTTPCRLVDTRNPAGQFGGPSLTGGSARVFDVLAGSCGIPSEAVSYAFNATVVPHGTLGFLSVYPTGQSQPVTSNLNSIDGRVKAVAAIVPAGTGGEVSVLPSNDTDFVLDVSGYFVPATNPTGLAFYPLAPCRLVDTRGAAGPLGGPSLVGSTTRTFPLLAGSCQIPSTAQVYSLNITSVPRGALGFLTTWPAGQAQPAVSTLNAPTGAVTANAALVRAGSNGDIAVFASNDSDVVIDINGYFAAPDQGGLSFFALTPCRVLDTRTTPGSSSSLEPDAPADASPFSGTLVVDVTGGGCGTPSTAQGYVFNATVVPQSSLGFLTLWPDGTSQPGVSTLNAGDGAVTSNLAVVPTINGSIDAFASNVTHLILDIFGYFAR